MLKSFARIICSDRISCSNLTQIERSVFQGNLHHEAPTATNKAQPEGSIANARIMEECLTFVSRYLSGVETKCNRMSRNDLDKNYHSPLFKLSIFQNKGNPLGRRTFKQLGILDWEQAQLYVLMNCPEVQPFVENSRHKLVQMRMRSLKSMVLVQMSPHPKLKMIPCI